MSTTALIVVVVILRSRCSPSTSPRAAGARREGRSSGSAPAGSSGSEYDRAAEERGSEEEAEREFRERRSRVERVFAENPERSIELAYRAVADLLEERNVVTDSAQSDADTERDLAVGHPDVADDYREARRIRADVVSGSVSGSGDEATEELRQAIRKYRAVHERLLRS